MDLLTDRMLVHLLKTKHHPGHGNQCVPTFPSLRADTERSTRAASRGKRSRHGQSETTANLNRRLAVCQSRDDVRQDHQASGTGRMASRVAKPQKLSSDGTDGDVPESRRHGLARQQRANCREARPASSRLPFRQGRECGLYASLYAEWRWNSRQGPAHGTGRQQKSP